MFESNHARLRWTSYLPAIVLCLLAVPAFAQPPGGPRGGGRGGPPMFGGGSGLEILFLPNVRDEIELVEEQEDQLRELSERVRDGMRSAFEGIGDLPPEVRREAIMSRMQEQQKEVEEEMSSILLDHQLERLKQLQLQTQLQRGSAADTLGSPELRETLGLSDEQVQQMRDTANEAEAELREQIRKATEEARNKVLAVLTPEQRTKWDELMGTPFQFDEGRRFGGPGFGGRGFGRRGGFGGGPPNGGPPDRRR